MKYTCTVCGFPELALPPERDMICPCCGTHFAYHDSYYSHSELREQWIERGAKWHSKRTAAPPHWSAYQQLIRLGIVLTPEEEKLLGNPATVITYTA
jgi:uncharacterized Zn finger protein (UPF0148 family)